MAAGRDRQSLSLALDFDLVAVELAEARKKHPHFIDKFSRISPDGAARMLGDQRHFLCRSRFFGAADFMDVIDCEVAEAIDAYARGDLSQALHELAQCAAVCIRGMDWIREAIAKGEEPIPF